MFLTHYHLAGGQATNAAIPKQNPESEKAFHQFFGQGLRSAGLEPGPRARSE
jgi:hypothetical protein